MRAMGIPYTAAHGTTCFSLLRYTTEVGLFSHGVYSRTMASV